MKHSFYLTLLGITIISANCSTGKNLLQDIHILHLHSAHTAFPDTGRAKGYRYDSVLYEEAGHYTDSSVLLAAPRQLQADSTVDLVFWFHGWRNTIDSAAEHFKLLEQFSQSKRNAVLVLAETARNAPDSYGGKLEQPGMFALLVKDILDELKKDSSIPYNCKPGNIVLAGHSGAYRVIAKIIQQGGLPIKEAELFDALYGEIPIYFNWLKQDSTNRFIHWYTSFGGGTAEGTAELQQQLDAQRTPYAKAEEDGLQKNSLLQNRILFIHSKHQHNEVINNPDNFLLLLQSSPFLQKIN